MSVREITAEPAACVCVCVCVCVCMCGVFALSLGAPPLSATGNDSSLNERLKSELAF